MLLTKSMRSRLLLGVVAGILLMLGGWYVRYIRELTINEVTAKAINTAVAAESGYSEYSALWRHNDLGGAVEQEHARLVQSLSSLVIKNQDIGRAFIFMEGEEGFQMIADSSDDHASLFSDQLRTKYALEYAMPNITGEVYVTDRIEDSEGTWISVLVPMAKDDSSDSVPVFAVDYRVSFWTLRAAARTAQASFVVLSGLLIFVAFWVAARRNAALNDEKIKMAGVLEEVEKTRSRLSRAQSAAHVGTFEYDINTQMIWVSEECFRIHGIEEQISTYVPFEWLKSLLEEHVIEKLEEAFQLLNDGEARFNMEYTFKHPQNGAYKTVHAFGDAQGYHLGKPTQIIGVIIDVTERKEAETELKEKEEFFRTIFEQSPVGIYFGNRDGGMLDVNPMFERITGRSKEELIRLTWRDLTFPDDLQSSEEAFGKFIANQVNSVSLIKRYMRPDGSPVWINAKIEALKIPHKPHLSHLCIIEDITKRIEAERELKEREKSYALLLSNIPGMAYRCKFDRDWTMLFVSDGCFELTGYLADDLLYSKRLKFNDLISPDYRDYLWNKWTTVIHQRQVLKEEYTITTASGEEKWVYEQARGVYDSDGNVEAIEGIIIDITDQKQREERILYLSHHDVLTGLYNREYFELALGDMNQEEMLPLSVIIADIDGIKFINDAFGHAAGDKAIISVSRILRDCIRDRDILARIGGDEFCILMPNTTSDGAESIMKKIDAMIQERRESEDNVYHVYLSLGYAIKESRRDEINSVLKAAEDHMSRRKLLQSRSSHSAILASMKTTLFEKSQETEAHAQRLIELSKAIGVRMNLTEQQLYDLELLSTLHDIGKIGISDVILNKPGALTEEEWKEMRKHPEIGYRIAMSSPELNSIAEYILTHHERWDGKGYPQGLIGEQIPLLSRIISIADAFDAMIEDRSYRRAMVREDAISEILKNSGSQFDPSITKLFVEEVVI